jgi:hypothetical protein
MSNILLSEQNKELLWNILSSNKAFVSIPESMFPNIKAIFENAIIKVNSQNKELVSSNYRTGDSKNIITQLNKIILQNIMLDINNFKKSLLTPIDIKDVYKNEKSEEFEKEFLQKKVSFTDLITKKVPETIDFRDTKDVPLENNSMNELLERIQKERNTILPLPQKLEVVDLDKFDTPSINEENVNNLEKATINNLEKATINNDTTKTKIMNIEDLISSLATNTNANSTHNSVKKFIAQENNGEFNLNINIKLDFLNKQLEKVLNNQKLIMTKLNI